MQDNPSIVRAGFGPRAAAFLVDQLLIGLALCLVRLPFWLAGVSGGLKSLYVLFDFSVMDLLCWLLLSAYYVLLTYFTGSTLGKKVMGLCVVREGEGSLRLIDVLYRETIGRYLSGILCLGYLMALVDGKNRAFHDYLCDTAVVYDRPVEKSRPSSGVDYTIPGEETQEGETAQTEPAPLPAAPSALGYTIPTVRAEAAEENEPDLPPED